MSLRARGAAPDQDHSPGPNPRRKAVRCRCPCQPRLHRCCCPAPVHKGWPSTMQHMLALLRSATDQCKAISLPAAVQALGVRGLHVPAVQEQPSQDMRGAAAAQICGGTRSGGALRRTCHRRPGLQRQRRRRRSRRGAAVCRAGGAGRPPPSAASGRAGAAAARKGAAADGRQLSKQPPGGETPARLSGSIRPCGAS